MIMSQRIMGASEAQAMFSKEARKQGIAGYLPEPTPDFLQMLERELSGSVGAAEMQLFAGRTIDQPSIFIAGASDWGPYQSPGALERMQEQACTDLRGVHMVDGAGHWVQQEQPEAVNTLLVNFLTNV